MRIALITLFDAYNCGSFLQAFAMQSFLLQQGHEVDVLDCSTNRLRRIQRLVAMTPRRQYLKIKKRIAYGNAWKKLNIVRISKKRKYDVAVIGSDEIWNLANPYFEHWPQYFGEKVPAAFVIAYAPSVGYSDVEKLLGTEQVKSISNMTKVFARDDSTAWLAQRIRNEPIQRVCDPTLLIAEQWVGMEQSYLLKKPYVIVYSYNPISAVEKEICGFAKENGYEVVSVAFDCKWADRVVVPTPLEFLCLVHHAKAIFGSTFHISVFASIYQVPFCVKSDMQKVIDFLHITNQKWRIYEKTGDLVKILEDKRNMTKEQPWIPTQLIEESKNAFVEILNSSGKE